MSEKVKFKEVHIQVEPGVTVIAEITSASEIKPLLKTLKGQGFTPTETTPETQKQVIKTQDTDDPAAQVETRAELTSGSLKAQNILAFKDGVPQLLRPNAFSTVSDVALALVFAVEAGLKQSSISFENFKPLYDDQNIKSGTSLSMLVNNLKNAGYLNNQKYAADRTIALTAKGEKKASEVLRALTEG